MQAKRNLLSLFLAGAVLAVLAVPVLGMSAAVAATESHSHEHDSAVDASALRLNNGQKWATDAPLRASMSEISRVTAAALPVVHSGKMTAEKYAKLGAQLEAQIANIVHNCKLEPAADEALHVILAELLHGNEVLQGKAAGAKRTAGVVAVVKALGKYGEYFDQPGFKAPRPEH
jgi:hypothetical protein